MGNFSYRVHEEYAKLNDGQCCFKMATQGGWHFYRCKRKAKQIIDGIGLCSIHARVELNWRKK